MTNETGADEGVAADVYDGMDAEEVIETISVPREVRIVNMSEVYAAEGNKGRVLFTMEGSTVKIDTPGNLIRRGKAPFVKDTRYVSPIGPPRSAILMGYAKVGARQPGGDGGLRNYDTMNAAERADLAKQTALKRLAEPGEIADVIHFLCSERNTYITGQAIIIDGGFCCR